MYENIINADTGNYMDIAKFTVYKYRLKIGKQAICCWIYVCKLR